MVGVCIGLCVEKRELVEQLEIMEIVEHKEDIIEEGERMLGGPVH